MSTKRERVCEHKEGCKGYTQFLQYCRICDLIFCWQCKIKAERNACPKCGNIDIVDEQFFWLHIPNIESPKKNPQNEFLKP